MVALAALAAAAALPAPAGAVLAGRNGRIVFTSGRTSGDNTAQLFLRTTVGSSGSGSVGPALTPIGGQTRHGSWSPDRTKIVYANGLADSNPATQDFDLFVKDMVTGSITALDAGEIGDSLSSDHPAWSPDGTRIAYEHQPSDASTDRDIMVKTVGTSAPAVNLTTGGPTEFKPAWSPDSSTIYYAEQNATLDIVKRPAGGGTRTPVLASTTVDEYQPSISPDGTQICFTKQGTPGNTATADIEVAALATPATQTTISFDTVKGDINCTWSPDGTLIAYSNGTFSQAALTMARADGTSSSPIPLTDSAGNFDGNADWAPDGRPVCPDSSVTTPVNKPVQVPLECTDTGPDYERTPVNESITNDGNPSHGTIGQIAIGDTSVTYTPNAGFKGNDSIEIVGFDDFGFGDDHGKITIHVTGKPVISKLKLTPSEFKAGKHGGSVVTGSKVRSKVSYRLDQDAKVGFRVLRRGAGRKVGGKCVKRSSSNSGRPHCDLLLKGSFKHSGKAGKNTFGFSGRLNHHRLGAGSYYLRATATDPFGRKSKSTRAKFTIKKP